MVALDKFCFCLSLRMGCLIIGYLYIVIYAVGILATIAVLILNKVVSSAVSGDKKHGYAISNMALLGVGLIAIVVLALFMVLPIVFLVGVHKEKRGHVKVFLVFLMIGVVFAVLGFIGALLPLEPEPIIINLLSLLLQVYMMVVVKSYHQTMGAVKSPIPKQTEAYQTSESITHIDTEA